jgi:trans-o-hydroxybenzylidenepyruvate hydratase-aldolase
MRQRKTRLTAQDVKGAWAIMPTPAKSNASDWRATDTVDLDETARVVEALIQAGVDGILSLGTLGECAALTLEEKRAFIGAAVETARGRVPVFAGTTALATRDAVAHTRMALDLGADGTMIGPGMWNKPDANMAAQFYRDLAEAVPEMPICIYANSFVFKFDFPPAFWAQVCEIPQVISAKIASAATYLRDQRASRRNIRLLPIDAEFYAAARLDPDTAVAFWSSSASCGPAPAIALREYVEKAKQTGDWSQALTLSDKMTAASLPTICYGDWDMFQTHNISLEKLRMDTAGWLHAGPNRPPYQLVPEKIKEYGRIAGENLAALHQEYDPLVKKMFATIGAV